MKDMSQFKNSLEYAKDRPDYGVDVKKEKKIKKAIAQIEELLAKKYWGKKPSYRIKCSLFHQIEVIVRGKKKRGSLIISYLQDYLAVHDEGLYHKLDQFFMDVHGEIRKKAEASPEYWHNIYEIIHNCQVNVFVVEFSVHEFTAAYEKTLDWYKWGWNGYWSLIGITEHGKIEGVYLGDTADREAFWGELRKIRPVYNRLLPKNEEHKYARTYWKNSIGHKIKDNLATAKTDNDKGRAAAMRIYTKGKKLEYKL